MPPTLYYSEPSIDLYLGDCREWLPTLAAGSVDLVIADPPYGQSRMELEGRAKRTAPAFYGEFKRGRSRAWEPIAGDDAPFDPSHLLRFSRLVCFGANHYADRLPPSGSWLVWDKRDGGNPDDNADAELAWSNVGGPVRLFTQRWRGFIRDDWGLEPSEHLHPTQKPVALMQWLMERYTRPGDLVLDPYAGCGPVLVAGKRLGRRVLACELSEAYCETTAKRLRSTTPPLPFDPAPPLARQLALECP